MPQSTTLQVGRLPVHPTLLFVLSTTSQRSVFGDVSKGAPVSKPSSQSYVATAPKRFRRLPPSVSVSLASSTVTLANLTAWGGRHAWRRHTGRVPSHLPLAPHVRVWLPLAISYPESQVHVTVSWKVRVVVLSLLLSVTARWELSTGPGSWHLTGKHRKSSPSNLPSAWQVRVSDPLLL